jgi:hypothetical protein
LDSEGNAIFSVPISKYQEGFSRVISIEVYEDTPAGFATLTIMGELDRDANGNSIPPEWRGKYNVKYTKSILVDPSRITRSPLRFYNQPELSVQEFLSLYRIANLTNIASASTGLYSTVNKTAYSVNDNPNKIDYLVIASASLFNGAMVNGGFSASINGVTYSSSIADVWSNRIIKLSSPFNNGTSYLTFPTTTQCNFQYYTSSYTASNPTRSFAQLSLTDLNTFSGYVFKSKFYVRKYGNVGDYQYIGEKIIEGPQLNTFINYASQQLLLSGENVVDTGYIKDPATANFYWIGDYVVSASYVTGTTTLPNVGYTSDYIPLNSMYLLGSASNLYSASVGTFYTASVTPVYFIGANSTVNFTQDTEYKLTLDMSCLKDSSINGKMDIYFYGTAFPSSDPFGVKIASYTTDTVTTKQDFVDQDINFITSATGTGALRFLIYGGQWLFANVKINVATDRGFVPNDCVAIFPILATSGIPSGTMQFKAELIDVQGETVPITIESPIVRFTGA